LRDCWLKTLFKAIQLTTLRESQLLDALRQALTQQWPQASQHALEPLKAKGLAHDHVRIVGTGYLARIPKQSQMQLGAMENLLYQQACFDRASTGGFAPRCIRLLEPCQSLPRGALVVDEILGRTATLPQDLPLIAQSLAALHRMPLPEPSSPKPSSPVPLLHAADPLLAMWEEVSLQAAYLPQAGLAPSVQVLIEAELHRLQALCQSPNRPSRRLIAFDGHPGNYVITSQAGREKAYLVDIEKCRYSYPSFDLAHATLYTSTTWDLDSHTILSPDDVMTAYEAWSQHVDAPLAQDAKRWHLPLRRAMWLWSLTWCAKWRVASLAEAARGHSGEDWSEQNLESALAAHVRGRVDHYLSLEGVRWVCNEFEALEKRMAAG
jgi:hypothetical protein